MFTDYNIMLRLSGAIERHPRGKFPSLSVNNNGVVVEVHQPSTLSGTIYCQVGHIKQDEVVFREEREAGIGKYPKVAVYDNYVVKVHEGEILRKIYFDFGRLDDDFCIAWKTPISDSPRICNGRLPAVAVYGNRAVITYDSAYIGWNTYYRIGIIDEQGESIKWGEENKLFQSGATETSVALNQDYVISAGRGWGKIRYIIGRINEDGAAIEKLYEVKCDAIHGYRPSLCMDNEGYIVMMWQSSGRELLYVNGELNVRQNPLCVRINWGNIRSHGLGYNSAISLSTNNNYIVEEHETNTKLSLDLFYCTGELQKRQVAAMNRDDQREQRVDDEGRPAGENEHARLLDHAREMPQQV